MHVVLEEQSGSCLTCQVVQDDQIRAGLFVYLWANRSVWMQVGEVVSPEVGEAVEGGLFVENVSAVVHDDGAVYKIFCPVWPTTQIQCQIPVRPSGHIVVQVLQSWPKRGN